MAPKKEENFVIESSFILGYVAPMSAGIVLFWMKMNGSKSTIGDMAMGGGPQNLDSVLSSDSNSEGRIRDEQVIRKYICEQETVDK